jgi:hypothetical protein
MLNDDDVKKMLQELKEAGGSINVPYLACERQPGKHSSGYEMARLEWTPG